MNDPEQQEPDPEPWAVIERSAPGFFRVTVSGELNGIELYVGAAPDSRGRPQITSVALLGSHISARNLREIPLGRIEAALSQPRQFEWIKKAESASHPLRHLQEFADEGPQHVYRQDTARERLTRPDRSDPAAFYARVAAAYRHYVQHSSKPAVDISVEAGVPVATARRWINHARELGLLEKGRRGRAI